MQKAILEEILRRLGLPSAMVMEVEMPQQGRRGPDHLGDLLRQLGGGEKRHPLQGLLEQASSLLDDAEAEMFNQVLGQAEENGTNPFTTVIDCCEDHKRTQALINKRQAKELYTGTKKLMAMIARTHHVGVFDAYIENVRHHDDPEVTPRQLEKELLGVKTGCTVNLTDEEAKQMMIISDVFSDAVVAFLKGVRSLLLEATERVTETARKAKAESEANEQAESGSGG